jgi:F0F1-type ATP synthase membrane subunit b/b'
VNYELISTWSQVISAILFLAVLIWLAVKLGGPAVLAARDEKNKQIAEAERHRDEAKAAVELLRAEMEGASHDAQSIRTRAAEQAAHERAAALAEATDAGERSLRGADGELDRARAAARDRLRTEILERALQIARTEASARVDAAANAKLVANFVSALERENG